LRLTYVGHAHPHRAAIQWRKSASAGADSPVRPLRSTNSTIARKAQRLLPSCRVRLDAAETGLRRGQCGRSEPDPIEVGDRLGGQT